MKFIAATLVLFTLSAFAAAQNEEQPIVEKEVSYRNWTLKDARTDEPRSLVDLTRGKRLVIVAYYAPWCPNWRHNAPVLISLYEKYKDKGLEVIGVSEYDLLSNVNANAGFIKATFPIVYESQSREDREKTTHYTLRRQTGDSRKWGSPYYVFLTPASFDLKGENVVKKAFVINGEMIAAEAEAFIRKNLGLKPEAASFALRDDKPSEICAPAKSSSLALKP